MTDFGIANQTLVGIGKMAEDNYDSDKMDDG